MKTHLRKSSASNGTRAKIERIVKSLRTNPPARHRELATASGAKIFAIWKEQSNQKTKQKMVARDYENHRRNNNTLD